MKRSWLIRCAAFGAGAILLAGAVVQTSVKPTSASWNDSQAAGATLKALVVPPVGTVDCRDISGSLLVAPSAEIAWSEVSSPAGVTVKYEVTSVSSDGITSVVVQPGSKRTYDSDLVEWLLGLLISPPRTFEVFVRTVYEFPGESSQWTSVQSTLVKLDFAGSLAGMGGGFTCR